MSREWDDQREAHALNDALDEARSRRAAEDPAGMSPEARLRRLLRWLPLDSFGTSPQREALEALASLTSERDRRERAAFLKGFGLRGDSDDVLAERVLRAEAERDRLREALAKLEDLGSQWGVIDNVRGEHLLMLARAALDATPSPSEEPRP